MKRLFSIVLMVVLLLSVMSTTVANAASKDDTEFSVVVDKASVVEGETVVVTVNIAKNPGIMGADMTVNWPEGSFEYVSSSANAAFATNSTLNSARIVWMDANNIMTTGEFFVVTLKALKAGTHTISLDGYVTNYDVEEWTPTLNSAAVTVTSTSADYSVTVANPSSDLVAKGGEFTVNVNVNNAYNSAKIELSYDSNFLEVVSCAAAENTDNTCSFNYATAGTILILDYGAENATDADYTVTFRAKDATTGTDVKVVSAGISTAEKAAVEDLTPVDEGNRGTVAIPVGYTVTVPTTGEHTFKSDATTVLPDKTVKITPNNQYYDYELEATNAILTKNQDGTWTLSGVTENTVITVKTSTPKKYDVTVKTVDKDGNPIAGIDDVVTSDGATYGVQYQYTLPDDEEVVGGIGTSYSFVSIMVGNEAGVYSTSDRTSTIEGPNVTGDIVITIRKEDKDPNAFNVTMNGETSAGQLSATQVAKEKDAVLNLNNKLAGYIYSVTATMGGQSVQVAQSGDVYTVANVTGNVVFTISKSLDVTNLDIVEYLSLDGKTVWLAKISGEIAGKTYAYKISENKSANFFWSSKYGAYCYLVVEATSVDITAETVETMVAGKLSLLDNTTAVSITYNGNVNMSKNESGEEVIDVNDAQLVWNMYNAYYSDFTQVSVEKFLRADMDSEIGIGTNDAAEIIKLIPKN